jgi:hypothetical protein
VWVSTKYTERALLDERTNPARGAEPACCRTRQNRIRHGARQGGNDGVVGLAAAMREATEHVNKQLGRAQSCITPRDSEKAYAAGFFDGEGHITIAAKTVVGARGLCYTMRVGATQNDIAPLFWLRDRWGGSINPVRRRTTSGNTTYVWMCFTHGAVAFLRDVLPYLQVKKERALVALRFQASVFVPGAGGHTVAYRRMHASFKAEINRLNTHKSASA